MNQLAGKALLLQGIDLIKERMEALDPEITAPQKNQRQTDRPPIGGSVLPQNVGAFACYGGTATEERPKAPRRQVRASINPRLKRLPS